MSILDKYKETLKEQGINTRLATQKHLKPNIYFIVLLAAAIIAAPSYFLLYENYNTCSIYSVGITGGTASRGIIGPFSLNCATDFALYSVVASLIIIIISLLFLKVLKIKYR
jgi:hypothetical protein